ncbi:MAG TPA: 50S ribosomal protein L9 [Clostridiaceae bacterium]|nr:50S ribosomal protein L9 [Clostridiaceae bacterium]
MKVILRKDVKGLGKTDDLVEVSDGYARNYLLPKGLAVEANAANISLMNAKKKSEEMKNERELEKARKLAERIREVELVISARAGENGKLFGAITGKDIAEKLKSKFNIDVDKKKINLPEAIKSLGTYEVEIKLLSNIHPKLKVNVVEE